MTCPHCSRTIGNAATVCVFCGLTVVSIDPAATSEETVPAAPAEPRYTPPPPPVMSSTAPSPATSDIEAEPWPSSTPYTGSARAASFWPPSRRTSIVAGTLVILALVAGGAVLVTSGGATPSRSPSAPGHLTAAQFAQDRQAQSDLRNALIAAKVRYTDSSSYSQADASGLGTIEPKLCYVAATTASVAHGAACVSGHASASESVLQSGQAWSAARMSASGTCFWIHDDTTVGTTYGSGLPCTGSAAVAASASDTFPGQAAGATRPATVTGGCIDIAKVLRVSADARFNERLAVRSISFSLAIDAALRAAGDWRTVAGEFGRYPRIAAGFRTGASRLEAATDALARGDNAGGMHLWRRGLASIQHSSVLVEHLKPSTC